MNWKTNMWNQIRVVCVLLVVLVILFIGGIHTVYKNSPWMPPFLIIPSSARKFAQSVSEISISVTDKLQKQEFRLQMSPHRQDYITEEEAMKDGPLTEVQKTADVTKSTVVLILDKKRTYNTGETIEIPIILRDGYGHIRSRGGDKLRVRMYNTTLGAFIAGRVLDHSNGSYTATVPALWPGINKISIFLAYTRETVRAIYYIRQKIQGTRFLGVVFKTDRRKQITSCHADRRWLTQYPDVCNLTLDNGGMSWYCGKPQSKQVTCSDWAFYTYVNRNPKLPLTEAEKLVMKPKWELFPDTVVEVKGMLLEKGVIIPRAKSKGSGRLAYHCYQLEPRLVMPIQDNFFGSLLSTGSQE